MQKSLIIVLYLVAAHSIGLGLLILFSAPFFLDLMGTKQPDSLFFPHQSGVFLIILGCGYALAAGNPLGRKHLVYLTILSKAIATIFLFAYFLLGSANHMVFLAGIGDLGMGLVITVLFLASRRISRMMQGSQVKTSSD